MRRTITSVAIKLIGIFWNQNCFQDYYTFDLNLKKSLSYAIYSWVLYLFRSTFQINTLLETRNYFILRILDWF